MIIFKHCLKKCSKGPKIMHFLVLFAICITFIAVLSFFKTCCMKFLNFWNVLAFFSAAYTNFVCCNGSVRQQIMCSSRWLRATNKSNLCHSDSVHKKILKQISTFFVACDKVIGKKQTNILPNLNCTTTIKLLWGTLI